MYINAVFMIWQSDLSLYSVYLTAHNWQKWKIVFLTCPCHEIYRDEAVGLKSCKYTWKIMIYVEFRVISWKILYFISNCLIEVRSFWLSCSKVRNWANTHAIECLTWWKIVHQIASFKPYIFKKPQLLRGHIPPQTPPASRKHNGRHWRAIFYFKTNLHPLIFYQ